MAVCPPNSLSITTHNRINAATPLIQRLVSVQSRAVAGDSAMANSVRVAAAQMTSINDLAANFATCSRLVKVPLLPKLFIFCSFDRSMFMLLLL